nr:TonB-dependent receptor [uncultured Draconibacterium sp.]
MKKNELVYFPVFGGKRKSLLTMKLSLIFLFACFMQVSATVYSQGTKFSFEVKNKQIEDVLREIENKSEFRFFYQREQVDVERKIDLNISDRTVEEILPILFKGQDVAFDVRQDNLILIKSDNTIPENVNIVELQQQQQQIVSGLVTDDGGQPLPGVNIVIKGTTIGTVSDVDGKYTFASIDPDVTLIFSFIGYVSQEIPVQGRKVIDVTLTMDALGLDEVVVVGYGSQQKESLTGAISNIQSDEILTTKTASVATMVQGKIPGLMIRKVSGLPGAFNSMISVRGFGAPLLVIDGVIRDEMSDFERLNPEDIESISVLKDASAAVYGMNADNGVLIVTTKSGKAGKTKVNYNVAYDYKQPTNAGNLNTVDAYHYRLYKNEMRKNYRQPQAFSDIELEKWRLGTEPGYQDYDWYNNVIANGRGNWRHNVSISGGNEAITHYSSFSFLEDKGILMHNETNRYKKFNVRTAFDANIAKGLTFSVKVAGKYDVQVQPPQSYFWIYKQMYVSDRGIGPYTLATRDSNEKHYSSVPAEGVNVFAKMNPAGNGGDGYDRTKNYQYQLSGEMAYDLPFVEGLKVSVLGAFDGNFNQHKLLRGSYSLYDYMTDALKNTTQASIQEDMSHFNRIDVQTKISYENTFGESHKISALLVNELRQLSRKNVFGWRQYDQIFTHDILDQASTTNQRTAGGYDEQAYLSYIGRFNYAYKGKYLFEFAFREDGSYRYAPEQRWAFFPSGSIGWRVSEESFMDKFPIVSNLKIRGSYGKMGADAGDPFQYVPGYSLSDIAGGAILSPGQLILGMVPPGVVNNNLTWIKTETADIGIDVGILDGKWGLVADIFQKTRNGLLATRATSVPNTFGASFPEENLESDKYKGFELEIRHKNSIRDFSYSFSANLTYARRFLEKKERAPYQSTWEVWKDDDNGDGRIQGRTWGYTADGIYNSLEEYETAPLIGGTRGNSYGLPGTQRVVDVNGDGVINSDDQLPNRWANDINPPLQYGLSMLASWKNFDFTMVMQGASLFTYPVNASDIYGYKTYPSMWTFWEDRWHTADPNANPFDPSTKWTPGTYAPLQDSWRGTTQGTSTDLWRIRADYLRIKTVELGYNVPAQIVKKAHFQNLRLAVNVVNLHTFVADKKMKMFDPEVEAGAWDAGLTYPIMREFNFILSVNF